ncbi:PLP-dependent aminotransferase family protein [Undibacterium sp. Ji67W]|uniref:aminotransferase-like domain-containing protein n=1 Tax=Undibacterium sp. Ji67W TaxID=3413042 RepID=UPI003BF1499C
MPQSKSIHDESQAIAWLGQFVQHGGPRYLQIADFIERALDNQQLKTGDRLPSQRRMATLLQVDLTTVTRAYEEAKRRQLLSGHGARGTYATAPKRDLGQMLDLSMNIPPPPANVDLAELLKQGLAQVQRNADDDLLINYHLGGGSLDDRAAGAAWLRPMLGTVTPEQITVCPGAQAALAAVLMAFTKHGDVILAEPAIYPGLRMVAEQCGRRIIAVEIDDQGMRPDALEHALQRHASPLVYLNPTLQNPTTHTMPAARRCEIAAVIARARTCVVEDDPYWLLSNDAPAPLATLIPDRVCYISTLSKCLVPGLRTAYVWISDQHAQEKFMAALRSFNLMTPPLTSALAAQWIRNGTASTLLTGIREEARQRQRLAVDLLAGRTAHSDQGIHIWLPLPGYWTASALVSAARKDGLAITSSDIFFDLKKPPNIVRIALGGIRQRERLAAALRRLSHLLARRPERPIDDI